MSKFLNKGHVKNIIWLQLDCFLDDLPLTSGFRICPKYRNQLLKHPQLWLKERREIDDVFPYWRVHNKLYDLSSFIHRHPGGKLQAC